MKEKKKLTINRDIFPDGEQSTPDILYVGQFILRLACHLLRLAPALEGRGTVSGICLYAHGACKCKHFQKTQLRHYLN